MEWLNEIVTIEKKWVLFFAIQYAVSFYILGFFGGSNRKEDEMLGRKPFWVFKHYWSKFKNR